MNRVMAITSLLTRQMMADDIFISYARADGMKYAIALADQLTSRGFSCRVDVFETEPSRTLPEQIRRDIRRSYLFVLVSTDAAAASEAVAQEIQEFVKSGRTIVVVGEYRAVAQARWAYLIAGLPVHREPADAVRDGQPAEPVVDVICNAFQFRRRNQRIQSVFWWMVAGMGAVVVGGVIGLATLARQADAARAARDRAGQQAEVSRGEAVRAAQQAQLSQAAAAKGEAAVKTVQAELQHQERRLGEAGAALLRSRQSLEQQQAATARQVLLNEALGTTAALQENRAGKNRHPARDAVAALTTAEVLGRLGRSTEASTVLIENLALLPLLQWRMRHDGGLWATAWSAGDLLATAGNNGQVRLWDPGTGEQRAERQLPGAIGVLKASPNGRMLVAIAGHSTAAAVAYLLNATTLEPIRQTPCARATDRLGWSPRSDRVALVCGGSVVVWSTASGQTLEIAVGQMVTQVQPDAQGVRIAIVTNEGDDMDYRVRFHSLVSGRRLPPDPQACGGDFRRLQFDSTGSRYATGCDLFSTMSRDAAECRVDLCDLVTGKLVTRLPAGQQTQLAFSPDGRLLAQFESGGGTFSFWDAASGRPVHAWALDRTRTWQGTFTPDGHYITAADGPWARVLDVASGDHGAMLPLGKRAQIAGVVRGGRSAVTVVPDTGVIEVWALQQFSPRSISARGATVSAFVFSPDGRQLLTVGRDARASEVDVFELKDWESLQIQGVWDTEEVAVSVPAWAADWVHQRSWSKAKNAVRAVSNDGRLLATGVDNGVKVWDAASGRQLSHVRTYRSPEVVGFSPDNRFVLASSNGVLTAWRWQPGELQQAACEALTKNADSAVWVESAGQGAAWRRLCPAKPS